MKQLSLILLLTSSILCSQNPKIDSLTTLLNSTQDPFKVSSYQLQLAALYERVDLAKGKELAYKALRFTDNDSLSAEINNQLGRFHFFTAKLDSAAYYFENTITLLEKLNKPERVAAVNISLGAIQLRQGDYNQTIKTLTESATFFEKVSDSINMAKCYSNIASAFAELERYPKAIEYSEKALIIFRNTNQTPFELITLPNLATQYYKNGDTINSIKYNDEAVALATKVGDKRSLSITYNNLGDIYLEKDPEKAKSYLEQTLQLKNELNLKKGIEITQSNLGYIHLKNKEYNTAIEYFDKAAKQIKGRQLVLVYTNMKEAYQGKGNMQKALFFSEKARLLNDSILSTEGENSYLELQTKYESEKKEREILSLQTVNQETDYKRKQNQNFLIAALAALALTLVLLYLLIKNFKRKQVIASQNALIEKQEFEQVLKNQELNGIDEILNAQEKERSKIAADLHDNLGSKVATLKLYLDSFNDKDGFDKFYNKLKTIVDNTYQDIRKIGSNKNFGALINKGLIPSTLAIADQISDSKKVAIKVINVDVNKRIENTIEIQIFRVIQELLTNIIKHSQATEAVIQFSEHENILNIIVEDNGIGFKKETPRNGVGLSNIQKRIERINGEMVIDSTLGHGTTVILNIPL